MEKYKLVGEKKSEISLDSVGHDNDDVCEVKITQQGKPKNYISYAMNLFAQGASRVVLKAMGRAINKAVTIAEILKRKMPYFLWKLIMRNLRLLPSEIKAL